MFFRNRRINTSRRTEFLMHEMKSAMKLRRALVRPGLPFFTSPQIFIDVIALNTSELAIPHNSYAVYMCVRVLCLFIIEANTFLELELVFGLVKILRSCVVSHSRTPKVFDGTFRILSSS